MGGSHSTLKFVPTMLAQSWPPKSKFAIEQIPDLTGRVIIVTGTFSHGIRTLPAHAHDFCQAVTLVSGSRRSRRAPSLYHTDMSLLTCCQALLQHNAKVYLAARSEERALGAISDLKIETGKEAIWLQLDLSDLASVKKAATEFLACVLLPGVLLIFADTSAARSKSFMYFLTMRQSRSSRHRG